MKQRRTYLSEGYMKMTIFGYISRRDVPWTKCTQWDNRKEKAYAESVLDYLQRGLEAGVEIWYGRLLSIVLGRQRNFAKAVRYVNPELEIPMAAI